MVCALLLVIESNASAIELRLVTGISDFEAMW